MTTSITVAFGDNVGPEIMEAALFILREAGAQISIDTVKIGKRIYDMQSTSGILPSSLQAITQNKVLLKGPSCTPEGEYRSVTETICSKFSLDPSSKRTEHLDHAQTISANAYIGEHLSMFEPVIGEEAILTKTKNKSNPSAMILASVMMLEHIGQTDVAARIRQACKLTLAEGIHTHDIYRRGTSCKKVNTHAFAEAVVERLYRKVA